MDIRIRELGARDAPAAARLGGELGYPISTEVMKGRIEFLTRQSDHVVFAACLAGEVIGWIHVTVIRADEDFSGIYEGAVTFFHFS